MQLPDMSDDWYSVFHVCMLMSLQLHIAAACVFNIHDLPNYIAQPLTKCPHTILATFEHALSIEVYSTNHSAVPTYIGTAPPCECRATFELVKVTMYPNYDCYLLV